jgi:hypothetical protein
MTETMYLKKKVKLLKSQNERKIESKKNNKYI